MHENNIELLRQEAIRLIKIKTQFLDEIIAEQGNWQDKKTPIEGSPLNNNQKSLRDNLINEQQKLERCEVVIAVVGTMKAGKSTTINAIVGREVLPNRDTAMTALPTLITHDPEQKEPVLIFSETQPIEALVQRIKDTPSVNTYKNSEQDINELLNKILTGQFSIKNENHGDEEIFKFLKNMNDLVRLSEELNVEFPYDHYKKIDELPVIKVKFAHLPKEKLSSTFTILDTPGHNEAGMEKLRDTVIEQLEKATGTVLVFDYSQLNTSASAEVQKIVSMTKNKDGLLYVVANKMDQSDRNGKGAAETQLYIKNMLEKKTDISVDIQNIFPISASKGFLSGKALAILNNDQQLPDFNAEPWVEDFLKLAFGASWKKHSENQPMITEGANDLWQESNVKFLLETAIAQTHSKAAHFVVRSGASQILKAVTNTENHFGILLDSFSKTAEAIFDQIGKIEKDITALNQSEATAKQKATATLNSLSSSYQILFNKAKNQATENLEDYFREGRIIAQEEYDELQNEQDTERKGFVKQFLDSLSSNKNSGRDFDPTESTLKFTKRETALEQERKISDSINSILSTVSNDMEAIVENTLSLFRDRFSTDVVESVKSLLFKLQSDMRDGGFTVPKFNTVNTSFLSKTKASDLLLSIVNEKKETRTAQRKKDYFGAGAMRLFGDWFGTDWGYEDVKVEEIKYILDIGKIKDNVLSYIDDVFDAIENDISHNIQKPLSVEIDFFFNSVRQSVEQIRYSLLTGLEDKKKTQLQQDELKHSILEIKKKVQSIRPELNALCIEVGIDLDN